MQHWPAHEGPSQAAFVVISGVFPLTDVRFQADTESEHPRAVDGSREGPLTC